MSLRRRVAGALAVVALAVVGGSSAPAEGLPAHRAPSSGQGVVGPGAAVLIEVVALDGCASRYSQPLHLGTSVTTAAGSCSLHRGAAVHRFTVSRSDVEEAETPAGALVVCPSGSPCATVDLHRLLAAGTARVEYRPSASGGRALSRTAYSGT